MSGTTGGVAARIPKDIVGKVSRCRHHVTVEAIGARERGRRRGGEDATAADVNRVVIKAVDGAGWVSDSHHECWKRDGGSRGIVAKPDHVVFVSGSPGCTGVDSPNLTARCRRGQRQRMNKVPLDDVSRGWQA